MALQRNRRVVVWSMERPQSGVQFVSHIQFITALIHHRNPELSYAVIRVWQEKGIFRGDCMTVKVLNRINRLIDERGVASSLLSQAIHSLCMATTMICLISNLIDQDFFTSQLSRLLLYHDFIRVPSRWMSITAILQNVYEQCTR